MMRGLIVVFLSLATVVVVHAQQGQQPAGRAQGAGQAAPGQAGNAPASGRAQAPYDLTGYWVALVTDDWRYRMLTPPKGNADYMPVNAVARRVMDAWDPAKDEASGEACRAYGAAGIMRLPIRLHITWESDTTLKMEIDAGTQTRRFVFGTPPAASGEPTWQGVSAARWQFPPTGRGARGGTPQTGQLVVTTRRMRPGYLRKNGVPYSANAVLTEYYLRLADEGQEYLAVTTMVDDPQYLALPYIKTYQFKKQANSAGWNPTPCSAR